MMNFTINYTHDRQWVQTKENVNNKGTNISVITACCHNEEGFTLNLCKSGSGQLSLKLFVQFCSTEELRLTSSKVL